MLLCAEGFERLVFHDNVTVAILSKTATTCNTVTLTVLPKLSQDLKQSNLKKGKNSQV